MAFLLRNISLSAEGREIVRTSRVRDDLIKVGRDPGNEIVLNDLAVALHHATLEQLSDSRIGISAEAGLTVEIDGVTSQGGQLDTVSGGTIKVGPFLLRILAAEMGSEDVAIDVARADTDADEERFDTRRFALATTLPGKRTLAWSMAVIVLGLFLAWPIYAYWSQRNSSPDQVAAGYHADRLWSSGPLSRGHASLENNCTACHARPFESVRDTSCTSCHTQVHNHADLARMQQAGPELGAWASFQRAAANVFGQTPGRCVDCHTEHEGAAQMLPTAQQFCSDCHTDLNGRLPDTRLADASNFETQHPQFQPSVLVRWDGDTPVTQRVSLDRRPREMSNLRFPHALHLNATGGVAQMGRRLSAQYGFGQQMECRDCHTPTPDGTRFQPVDMEADCGRCHSLAFETIGGVVRTLRHGEPRQVVADILSFARGNRVSEDLGGGARSRPGDVNQIRAAIQFAQARSTASPRAMSAVRQAFTPDGACGECHQVQLPASGFDYRIRPVAFPVRYMLHGWFDHRAHQIVQQPGRPRLEGSAACGSCHVALRSNRATDLLLPDLASCRTCHGGESTRLPVASTCAMCHDFHMDGGTPARLLRQRVRGGRWETTVTPVRPAAARGR